MFFLISLICIVIACIASIKPEKVPFGCEGQNAKMFTIYLILGILSCILANTTTSNSNRMPPKKETDIGETKENLTKELTTNNHESKKETNVEEPLSTHEVTLAKFEAFNKPHEIINYIKKIKYEKDPSSNAWSCERETESKCFGSYRLRLIQDINSLDQSTLVFWLKGDVDISVIEEIIMSVIFLEKRKKPFQIYLKELEVFLNFIKIEDRKEILNKIKKREKFEKKYEWGTISFSIETKHILGMDMQGHEYCQLKISSLKNPVKITEKEMSLRKEITTELNNMSQAVDLKRKEFDELLKKNKEEIKYRCMEMTKNELKFPSKADFSDYLRGKIEGVALDYENKVFLFKKTFEGMNDLGLMVPFTSQCKINLQTLNVDEVVVGIGEN